MSVSLWLTVTLGALALFGGRQALRGLSGPRTQVSDVERITSAFTLFAASWATGYAVFQV
jgi:hypothetical protein